MNLHTNNKIIKNKIGLLRLSETLGSLYPTELKNAIFETACRARYGVANPRDTVGYRCGLRLVAHPIRPFQKSRS